jgi:leucyl-tRNA synthetase
MADKNYNHRFIEHKWQRLWKDKETYKVGINTNKPKYYVLDMFPYPSGAGLHVGHPLGYIASDIVSRFKRHQGFNVLHPMGYDAFGLPAEQYAIETGQHPADTTEENINRYRSQLDRIGFSYDWSREIRTCDPDYYHWTQWIFIQLFHHWYNAKNDKAEHIDNLIAIFEHEGNINIEHKGSYIADFTADEWLNMSDADQESVLQCYRLAFIQETSVNWCEELGTVLANEEVKDGLSERGGYPVVKKQLKQWYLRITAYADRLLEGLEKIDWSSSIKEVQKNWIGKSYGAQVFFPVDGKKNVDIEIFTTRPDTIYGASFMVLAPEHELVKELTSSDQKEEVENYIKWVESRSERERMSEVDRVSGAFTGAFAINPITKERVPIWIADYVLIGYGTGAIMAVPAHDSRDHAFAKKFELPIIQVISSKEDIDVQESSFDSKEGFLINSPLINNLSVQDGIQKIIELLEQENMGKRTVNYKLRDAGFSRQRYWGEPFPVLYKNGIPETLSHEDLPLELPDVESYKPTGSGESPLAALEDWVHTEDGMRETDTMPGWAGSSWYFLRYLDPDNNQSLASREAISYWQNVDFYVGGSEHATGHLLYSRFWTKFLYDMGVIPFDEPFKKLVNQGMIQGTVEYLYMKKEKVDGQAYFKCAGLVKKAKEEEAYTKLPVHVDFLQDYTKTDQNSYLDTQGIKRFIEWRPEYAQAIFECSEGIYQHGRFEPKGKTYDSHLMTESEIGKMSKRWFNVVNPDDICEEYGADTLRMYEMFLGPIEDSKPWNTKGIDGVSRFLRKVWRLYIDDSGSLMIQDDKASKDSLKSLHSCIKKVTEDIEKMSLNTCISQFMITVNELSEQGCVNKDVLTSFLVLLSPFAPHLTEELWEILGNNTSITDARWPELKEEHLKESLKTYPISINGKTRTTLNLGIDLSKEQIEAEVMKDEVVQKWLDGKAPKKVIVVPGRIVNLVV